MVNRKYLTNSDFQTQLVEQFILPLKDDQHPYRELPVISIYYRIYLCLTEPEAETHFESLVRGCLDFSFTAQNLRELTVKMANQRLCFLKAAI